MRWSPSQAFYKPNPHKLNAHTDPLSITGTGMERALRNSWLKDMQDRMMVPHFRAGDFGEGFLEGLRHCDAYLRQPGGGLDEPLAVRLMLTSPTAGYPQASFKGGHSHSKNHSSGDGWRRQSGQSGSKGEGAKGGNEGGQGGGEARP